MRMHWKILAALIAASTLPMAALAAGPTSQVVTFTFGDGGGGEAARGGAHAMGPGAARTLRGVFFPAGLATTPEGEGGDLTATLVTNAPGCDEPVLTTDGLEFTCQWDDACFDFGESVVICFSSSKGELGLKSATLYDSEGKSMGEAKTKVGPPTKGDCKKSEPTLDCSGATASPSTLWPPNHRMVPISIEGVTSSSGHPVVITIHTVSQDEPVTGKGYGIRCPDGKLKRRGNLKLRAERGAKGNGRVYAISFSARDGDAFCKGVAYVCVPKDLGTGRKCADDGQKYNTLAQCKMMDMGSDDPMDDPATDPSDDFEIRTPDMRLTASGVEFEVPEDSNVLIGVYDVAGRRVKTLVNGPMPAGAHQVSWETGTVPNGMYFYRMTVNGEQVSKKLLIVK